MIEILPPNPFKPDFTIVIFIHYKPQTPVAILRLKWMKRIWCGWLIKENCHVLVNQFHGKFRSKTLSCREIKSFSVTNFIEALRCYNLKICHWLEWSFSMIALSNKNAAGLQCSDSHLRWLVLLFWLDLFVPSWQPPAISSNESG